MSTASAKAELLSAIVHERRSVRGFRPEAVSLELLRTIFTVAQQAPSNCNVQPWIVHVVSGGTAERLRSLLHDAARNQLELSPDIPLTADYVGEYRGRQIGAAKALFGAEGIARNDLEGRNRSFLRNFRFFDAPHAAFIFMPSRFGMREAADCGMYAQTLMLSLTAHGLASCPQGALSHHARIVREVLGASDDMLLLFGIAFGYEDPVHPANAARVGRAPLEETTIFHS